MRLFSFIKIHGRRLGATSFGTAMAQKQSAERLKAARIRTPSSYKQIFVVSAFVFFFSSVYWSSSTLFLLFILFFILLLFPLFCSLLLLVIFFLFFFFCVLLLFCICLFTSLLFPFLLFSSASLSGFHLECTLKLLGATSLWPVGLPKAMI